MAEEKKSTKESNPHADAQNWNQRVKGELEAPHTWNETWGQLFGKGVPLEYGDRAKYLEEELKKMPGGTKLPPKYGVGAPFKEIEGQDFRRKKLFYNDSL